MGSTAKQTFSSAATSINSTKLPAVYGKIDFSKYDFVFDYGCGRYTQHLSAAMPAGVEWAGYDAYNRSDADNTAAIDAIEEASAAGKRVAIVCSNVLNVIDNDDVITDIAETFIDAAKRHGATVYITVYEGSGSGSGRQTGADSWQRNEKLSSYGRFFRGYAVQHRGMLVLRR